MLFYATYVLIKKDAFLGTGKWLVEALKISAKKKKSISILFFIIGFFFGLNFLLHGIFSSDIFSAFWFIGVK